MVADSRGPLDDDALAAAFRASRTPAGSHLSDADWERLTCDEMTGAQRDAALAHIMSCPECTAIHRSLIQLRTGAAEIAAAGPPGLSEVEGRPNIAGRRFWAIAGGLATAAAIVAAVLINRPTRVDPDVMRSSREAAAIIAIAPQPGTALINRRFEWQPVAGADSYELRVSTRDGVRVFTSKRDETSAVLPNEIELDAGASYYWRVLAFKGDAELAASPLTPFTVAATSRER
jgi:hypothetical protein